MKHLRPLALFGALALGWTWPLALHLHDAVPGAPGDNYSFAWNLWWMRHVIATPGLDHFHTDYLFFPFGTTIVDHPHAALPAIAAATLLRSASVVTAQNILLLAFVLANMAAMYALAWDVTRHRRAAVLGGAVFGWTWMTWSPRTQSALVRRLRYGTVSTACLLGAAALWTVVIGGRTLTIATVALVVRDYWDAPIALTALDSPALYERLATAHLAPSATCRSASAG